MEVKESSDGSTEVKGTLWSSVWNISLVICGVQYGRGWVGKTDMDTDKEKERKRQRERLQVNSRRDSLALYNNNQSSIDIWFYVDILVV